MSSKYLSWLIVWAFTGTLSLLSGCGGETEVASNTPLPTTTTTSTAPASQSSPPSESESTPAGKSQASYGGEATSSNNSNATGGDPAYGGGMMGNEEAESSSPMGPAGMGGSSMGSPGMGSRPSGPPSLGGTSMGSSGMGSASMGTAGMNSSSGSEFGGEMMGGEMMGGEMMGDSSGFGGPGSFGGMQTESGIGMVVGFIRQNCANCHSGNNAKGGVYLDRIGPDIAADSQTWVSVVKALEDGSMPPRSARQPDPNSKARVIEFISDALGSVPEATFMERAEIAFRKGDVDKATQLYFAQLVTADDNEAAELANHIKLYRPVVTKPEDLAPTSEFGVAVKPKLTTQLKLGVGIILKLNGQISDVMPVGANQLSGGAGGGGEMSGMEGPGRAGPGRGGASNSNASNPKLEVFEDLTGDVGRALVDAFESRRSSGNYGTLFSSLEFESPADRFQQPGLGGDGGTGFGSGFAGGDESGGMVGMPGAGMGGAGRPGMGMGGGAPGFGMGPGMGMGGGENGEDSGRPRNSKTRPGKPLANGLLYIGKAENNNSLLKKCNEAGLDGMFVFEIEASKNLRNIVSNETRVKFVLPSGKVVASGSKSLKNTEIERAIAMGKDNDDVQKHVDQLFNRLDSVLKMNDLPQVSATAALKQLHTRVHSDADRLQVLAEARMFNAKGFISGEQLEMVYQVVLEGNEGTTLATGSAEDRKLVLTSFTEKL